MNHDGVTDFANRCTSCSREAWSCESRSELGYGHCCSRCDHRTKPVEAGEVGP